MKMEKKTERNINQYENICSVSMIKATSEGVHGFLTPSSRNCLITQ